MDLNNVQITSGTGLYRGTKLDLRTSFDLKHDGLPIFRRQFEGKESTSFDFDENILFINEHFFVTGENVTYSYGGVLTEEMPLVLRPLMSLVLVQLTNFLEICLSLRLVMVVSDL